MLYHRQRFLLSLLAELPGCTKIKLQKLMFLYGEETKEPPYSFFPYKYGPYSFTLENDLTELFKKGFVTINEEKINKTGLIAPRSSRYSESDLEHTLSKYGDKQVNDLLELVYHKFPQYTIKSVIREKYLTEDEAREVCTSYQPVFSHSLFTIGYEGRTIDSYLNLLLKNQIKLLVDVRSNPFSMKLDFIGSKLKTYCRMIDVDYTGFPDLGIESKHRKDFQNRDELLQFYTENILPFRSVSIKKIKSLITKYDRVAFTCFESDHYECHRYRLVSFLDEKGEYFVTHL